MAGCYEKHDGDDESNLLTHQRSTSSCKKLLTKNDSSESAREWQIKCDDPFVTARLRENDSPGQGHLGANEVHASRSYVEHTHSQPASQPASFLPHPASTFSRVDEGVNHRGGRLGSRPFSLDENQRYVCPGNRRDTCADG